ncbi:MAG: PKD domain-containing protein [Bacteroidia bacterium]|nr:PKD domain-containing protein [Bacteroidia bacterium]
MKKLFTLSMLLLFFAGAGYTQHDHQHTNEIKCLTQYYYEEAVKENPQVAITRNMLDYEVQRFLEDGGAEKNAGVIKVIPVVFHIIHEGGSENISKAQIQDQVARLNLDFQRLNSDAANTPAVFQGIAADSEIEFRLAQLDPSGNCTDGIVRVFSNLTNNARNNVKALSYWPSNKYLNVWIVKTIENTSGVAGIILGFAQFPGGSAATDGIVLRHDYTGAIGTAQSSNYAARTMTHEVGHWLGLRHIWGDGTCATDFVSDTPPAEGPHSGCPSHPYHTNQCGAGSSPNGEMFMNYMDYTNGTCQNMFTNGQKGVMVGVLNSSVSGRNNLWSASNLAATGTDGSILPPCAPIADFSPVPKYVCAGTSASFTDFSWNGDPSAWDWQFPGGTPSSSTAQNPTIVYNTPGVYDVTLTASNSSGSSTKTITGYVRVSPATGAVNSYPFQEGFESGNFPPTDWFVDNESLTTNEWELTSLAARSGANSVYIQNASGNTNGIDNLVTTTYNFTNVTNPQLLFWRAFALSSSTGTARLRVLVSTSCGNLWQVRYNKSGATLATIPSVIASNFIPNASQWDADTLTNLNTYSGNPNVRFKFEYTQDGGNNIYLDDININGLVGINEIVKTEGVTLFPNPAEEQSKIEFSILKVSEVEILIHDLSGRKVQNIAAGSLTPGDYVYDITGLTSGSYTVTIQLEKESITKKLIIQ